MYTYYKPSLNVRFCRECCLNDYMNPTVIVSAYAPHPVSVPVPSLTIHHKNTSTYICRSRTQNKSGTSCTTVT